MKRRTKRRAGADTALTAVRRILRRQRKGIRERIGAAARNGGEPLRLVRSSLRRIRVLLKYLPETEQSGETRKLRFRLGRLDDTLSRSRDLDVLTGLLDRVEAPPALRRHLQRVRRAQTTERKRALARYPELDRRLQDFASHELPKLLDRRSAARLAADIVRAAAREANEHAADAHSRNMRKLHRLRIEIRRVRLLASVFDDILGHDGLTLSQAIHSCERALGRAHDAERALERIAETKIKKTKALEEELRTSKKRSVVKFRKYWPHLHVQLKNWTRERARA